MKKDSSTNALNRNVINSICGTAHALTVFGGRWKATILQLLLLEKMRFSDLKKIIPGISEKMLVQQLKELEKDGIVNRTVFAEVPPRVEYELTEIGRSMEKMMESISQWGVAHKVAHNITSNDIDPEKLSEKLESMCLPRKPLSDVHHPSE